MPVPDEHPRTPTSSLPGSIRNAEVRDLIAVSRLLVAVGIDPQTFDLTPRLASPTRHLLVLDIDGTIRGVAYVIIRPESAGRGCLQLVTVDPALAKQFGRAIEDRMVRVAVALCEAYGCHDVDIAMAPHEHVAAMTRVHTRRYG